jgi:hypothetical protein
MEVDIFAVYKNSREEAKYISETSEILYNGILYKTPTAAASAMVVKNGGGKHVTINGWKFWRYVDENGAPKYLSDMRQN